MKTFLKKKERSNGQELSVEVRHILHTKYISIKKEKDAKEICYLKEIVAQLVWHGESSECETVGCRLSFARPGTFSPLDAIGIELTPYLLA